MRAAKNEVDEDDAGAEEEDAERADEDAQEEDEDVEEAEEDEDAEAGLYSDGAGDEVGGEAGGDGESEGEGASPDDEAEDPRSQKQDAAGKPNDDDEAVQDDEDDEGDEGGVADETEQGDPATSTVLTTRAASRASSGSRASHPSRGSNQTRSTLRIDPRANADPYAGDEAVSGTDPPSFRGLTYAEKHLSELPVGDPPSPIRSQAAAMVDDIYMTIVQAAGGDDEVVSLALSRNVFDMKAKKAEMMQKRLDAMVDRKAHREQERKEEEAERQEQERRATPRTKKYLRRKSEKPMAPPVQAQPDQGYEWQHLGAGDSEEDFGAKQGREAERRIRQKQQEVLQMRRENQMREQRKLADLQQELELHESRKNYEREQALRGRRESLEAKRMQRLQRAQQRKKMLVDLKEDDTSLQYRIEQLERKKRMNDDYVKRVEMPELEKRKKVLKDLRKQFDPMDHEALKERERQYMRMMAEDVEASREQKKIDVELNEITAGKHYQGKYQQAANKEMQQERAKLDKAKEDKQERLARRKRYAELVSEMFPPTVDDSKKKELERRVDRLQHPVKKYAERAKPPETNSSHPPVARRRQRRQSGDSVERKTRGAGRLQRSLGGTPRSPPPPSPPAAPHLSPRYSDPKCSSRRDDPMAVGDAPIARLSQWGGEAHVVAHMARQAAREAVPEMRAPEHMSSAFADINPPRVRLSEGPTARTSAHTGGAPKTHRSERGSRVSGDKELGMLEYDLQKQAEESSAMMAAIKSRLDALENTSTQ